VARVEGGLYIENLGGRGRGWAGADVAVYSNTRQFHVSRMNWDQEQVSLLAPSASASRDAFLNPFYFYTVQNSIHQESAEDALYFKRLAHNVGLFTTAHAHFLERLPRLIMLLKHVPQVRARAVSELASRVLM
jgi:hypothetical protein